MSIDNDVPTVPAVSAQLHELLAFARRIKPVTTIEPPLPATELESRVRALSAVSADDHGLTKAPPLSTQAGKIAQQRAHACVETAARNIFYENLAQCEISEPGFVQIWNLLDIVQLCADSGKSDSSLALWLIEELLDSQTIDGCRRIFDYLESRRGRLITNGFNKNKQMIVLRSCNELLRRLSRAEDAVFCGRVFIFLFQSFPLGDKSAVNLRGEFHVENVTTFDRVVPVEVHQDDAVMKVDPEAETEADNSNPEDAAHDAMQTNADNPTELPTIAEPINGAKEETNVQDKDQYDPDLESMNLYPIFWSLQNVFSNPPNVFNDENMTSFKRGLELTLKKFKSVEKVLQMHGSARSESDSPAGTKRRLDGQLLNDDGQSSPKRRRGNNGGNLETPVMLSNGYYDGPEDDSRTQTSNDFATTFTPKSLTSPELFDLELSDLSFQRHILVQSLILLDFLLSLTPRSKQKLSYVKAQKAMLYPHTLSEQDMQWAVTMRQKIASYLQEGPDGKFYYRMVDNVLARDKNWVRWKLESCPSIERPPIDTEAYVTARDSAKKAFAARRIRVQPLGALDLSFLDDSGGEAAVLAELRHASSHVAPDNEMLVRNVEAVDLDIEFMDPPPSETDGFNKEGEVKEKDDAKREAIVAKLLERAALTERRAAETWRALRMGARRNLSVLGEIDEGRIETLKLLATAADPSTETGKETSAKADAMPTTDAGAETTNHDIDGTHANEVVNGHGNSLHGIAAQSDSIMTKDLVNDTDAPTKLEQHETIATDTEMT